MRERVRSYPRDHLEKRVRCNFGTNDQREQRRVREWVSLETSEGHEDLASTTDSVSTFSRGNDAGLACGHEQVKRVESVDAEVQSSAQVGKSKRVRVRSIGGYLVRTDG